MYRVFAFFVLLYQCWFMTYDWSWTICWHACATAFEYCWLCWVFLFCECCLLVWPMLKVHSPDWKDSGWQSGQAKLPHWIFSLLFILIWCSDAAWPAQLMICWWATLTGGRRASCLCTRSRCQDAMFAACICHLDDAVSFICHSSLNNISHLSLISSKVLLVSLYSNGLCNG